MKGCCVLVQRVSKYQGIKTVDALETRSPDGNTPLSVLYDNNVNNADAKLPCLPF